MIHVPLQGIAVLALWFTNWPHVLKFLIVLVVGLGGAIITWPLVRGTCIGRWLGSREIAAKAAATRTLES
jgi:hypothetical protein